MPLEPIEVYMSEVGLNKIAELIAIEFALLVNMESKLVAFPAISLYEDKENVAVLAGLQAIVNGLLSSLKERPAVLKASDEISKYAKEAHDSAKITPL